MRLIEAYVYEVTRRLPEKSRNDIAMELKSTIEDMLPDDPSEEEIKEALGNLGDPAVLAARYSEKPMYLIGPKVYDTYMAVMKKVIPWAIFITFLINVIVRIVEFNGEESILNLVINIFAHSIGSIIIALMHVFFWITLAFAFVERFGLSESDLPITKMGTPWTPEDLKHVVVIPKNKVITKGENIFGLLWTVIWVTIYFYAEHIVGIYRSIDGDGLQFIMPLFDQEVLLSYWPLIVITVLLEIALLVYKWTAKMWTMNLAIANAIVHLLSLLFFVIIAINPNLYNADIIPYFAELVDTSVMNVEQFLQWLRWIVIASVAVSYFFEVYNSFQKARREPTTQS